MLDHIVAGAIPYGVSVQENVVKECEEEAGIDRDLATSAQPTGADGLLILILSSHAVCDRGGIIYLSRRRR